jgi:uncharacterized protein YbjT (DUF2867 family)
MKILVTGGTGHLGQAIVGGLTNGGHHVRIVARRPGDDPRVEWMQADLGAAPDLAAAVAGVDAIVHAATNSPAARRGGFRPLDFVRSPTDVDIDGTKRLLTAAAKAEVQHFVHVSIVGLEHMAAINPYSRVKLEAEQLVRESRVSWSIVRATGFYWLLARMLANITRRSPVLLPGDVHMQPVDSEEFADFVVATVAGGQRGERQDFVGPETLTMRELAEQYLTARGLRRRIWNAPLPGSVKEALEAGNTSPCARRGTTTWAAWLDRELRRTRAVTRAAA